MISIAPAVLLSACAPPIVLTPAALPCTELVEASGLLSATPAASLPRDDSRGEWVAFGDRQTGQLDSANADKAGAGKLLRACAERQAAALAAARPRRWWQR